MIFSRSVVGAVGALLVAGRDDLEAALRTGLRAMTKLQFRRLTDTSNVRRSPRGSKVVRQRGRFHCSMIFSESRPPLRIKSGPGFFGIVL
jgi:hypothetical protein